MKKSSILIWLLAGIMVITAVYVVYEKNKVQNIAGVKESQSEDATKPGSSAEGKESSTASSGKTPGGEIAAPDFEAKDLQGNVVKLSDYKGKIVILNFWATWCTYCIKEMPDLDELDKELASDGDAVILALDSKESRSKVADHVKKKGYSLKVLLDEDGSITNTYTPFGIQGYPTTFIIGPDGMFYTYIPGMTDKKTLLAVINKLRNGEPVN